MVSSAQDAGSHHRALDFLAAAAAFAILYFARDLLIPIALAIFFAFLLAPLVRRLQHWGLGRALAVFAIVILTFSMVSVGSCFVGSRAMDLVGELPKYRSNIVVKARRLRESIGETLQPVSQTIDAVIQEISAPAETESKESAQRREPEVAANRPSVVEPSPTTAPAVSPPSATFPTAPVAAMVRLLRAALVPLLDPVMTLALAAIFAIFFLIHREDLRHRILRICGDAQISLTTAALTDAGDRISRYFGGLVLTNFLNGSAIAIGLAILGVPNALLFGVLAGILRFIPFLGTWLAAVFPVILSIAYFDTWTVPLLVVALFVLVDQLSAGIVEPWLYGARTGASPTAIILSMVIWTWLWGAIGLLLATPITVCLVVVGKYVPQFQALYVLLGDQPVLEPHAQLYQRLLVLDEKEATEILKRSEEAMSKQDVVSEVVIPALSLIAGDEQFDTTDKIRPTVVHRFIDRTLDRLYPVAEPSKNVSRAMAPEWRPRHADAILFGVHGPYDEWTAKILERLLQSHSSSFVVASPHLLIAELLDQLRDDRVRVVCLVTVSVRNASRMELVCRRIRAAVPEMNLVAGFFDPTADPQRLQRRLGRYPRLRISTTPAAAIAAMDALLRLRPTGSDPDGQDPADSGRRFDRNTPAFA